MTKLFLGICASLVLCTLPIVAHADEGIESYVKVLSVLATTNGVDWDKATGTEKSRLASFMTSIATEQALPGESSRSEQMAFWINAHNGCVMKLILDHWPVSDVMTIKGFRDRLTCRVAGQDLSLVEIVSGVMRPLFEEPKVHFALWWGTAGGPPLLGVPYEGKKLEQQLATQTRATLAKSGFIRFGEGAQKGEVSISPLFEWFKNDFGPTPGAVLGFLKKNLPKDQADRLPKKPSALRFESFDWSIDKVKT